MNPRFLQRVALVALVASMVVAGAIAWAPAQGATGGSVLALFKIAVLAFIFVRVRRTDLYAMQWSSMLILLFVAEGAVRAMSDAQPLAALGLAEALLAAAYFAAVLLYLQPLKKAARAARR